MKKYRHPGTRAFLVGLLLAVWLSGCTIPEQRSASGSHHHSFIDYWPLPRNDQEICLAVKDNIDVKGVVTSAGSEYVSKTASPASQDAACLAIARARHVRIIGKTNLSEFTLSPSGINDYFGTPRNPFSKLHQIIPGGSSSGSATAVDRGIADIAFGTDTAGSIRVPAACCGIVGLKTTFGLVSLRGVYPLEPVHMDTVGPMGKNIARVAEGMDLLERGFRERYESAITSARQIRIGRLYVSGTDPKIDQAIDAALTKAHFTVVPLGPDFKASWEQAEKDATTVAEAGAWITDGKYLSKPEVGGKVKAA